MPEDEQIFGTIRKIDERGYGFIKTEEFGADVFFHAKDVRRVKFETLRVGDKVSIGSITEKNRIDPKTQEEVVGHSAHDVYLVS